MMEQLLSETIAGLTQAGVDYAEVRHVLRERLWRGVKNDAIETATSSTDIGVAIRVYQNGAWGASSTQNVTSGGLKKAAERAQAVAKAAGIVGRPPVAWTSGCPQVGTYRTPVEIDPFSMDASEQFESLFAITDTLRDGDNILSAKATLVAVKLSTHLMTSEGTNVQQDLQICGGGMQVTAGNSEDVQTRSYPKDFEGNVRAGGWEVWDSFQLAAHAPRIRREAQELLVAPVCPPGETTVILANSQLSLHVHETCGHPSELDRALGDEISLAGGSFLRPEMRESFQYGSSLVNLTADATTPGGAGTFGWDDEGIPASRTPLIEGGQFVNYLSNRESSTRIGTQSSGAARANSWRSLPIVRMVNVNLEPGAGSLSDLIADTPKGFLIETNKSWSIDDLRLNFQFGCESATEIQNGRLGRRFKNPVYTGITPEFWRNCDGICGQEEWEMWGYLFCGKGDPMQSIHVGHGVAPARFRNIQVGATKGENA